MPMWIINWIREKLTQNLEYSMKEKLPKKIYIDRGDATSNQSAMRKIINEDEVQDKLNSLGFESIKLGNISLENQIKIFKTQIQLLVCTEVVLQILYFANLTLKF